VGGKAGGRSTHGICLGTLPWAVTEGWAGDVEYVENGATSGSGRRAPTS
jgi:hypothetical protein